MPQEIEFKLHGVDLDKSSRTLEQIERFRQLNRSRRQSLESRMSLAVQVRFGRGGLVLLT